MRKTFITFILFSVAFFAGCERYDHAIQDLNDRIEVLEGSSIAPIEEQIRNINASLADLQDVDKSLSGLIESLNEAASALQTKIDNNAAADAAAKKALEDELASVKELITALQKEDKSLDTKIADLKTYVDQIKTSVDKDVAEARTWVSTTFATLEQYKEMQTSIATISALVDTYKTDLEKGYTDAIAAAVADMEDAISDSEDAMEIWVNETLADGYYDIAEINALLAALETKLSGTDGDLSAADAELAKQIEEQIKALEQASKDLTAAYEKAIEDAIEDNNGLVSKEIADAVETATETFNTKIDAINAEIALMKKSIGALEDKFASRIQSIRFLPEYSDGKVELTSRNPTAELTFLISPSNLAAKIATAYRNNTSVVTAYLSLTQERTRAVGTPTQINVTKVTGTADGVLTVEVNAENLPANYWANNENANLFIRINDGNNDVISEMIPTFYTVLCELPEGSKFRTAVHAQLADDTKAIKFIANSKVVTEHQIGTSPAYMQLNGTTLEIHTAAKEFIFNKVCSAMFSTFNGTTKFANITTIVFNGCINTSKVTLMGQMFYGCQALNSLDLSSFNTANVTTMGDMFYGCKALNSLDLSSFNTANVTTMGFMFFNCTALESLNLNSFNTAKVTNMSYMFSYCEALESLNLSSFDTANVTNMSNMFSYCKALNSLDLNTYDTANVTDMSYMFYCCKALNSLDLSGFDTTNVTNMHAMFRECEALESLDLSSFNTANVTNMNNMFRQCKALKSLDIRTFDIGKVTDFTFIFNFVGYNAGTGSKTPIKVTSALHTALKDKDVSTGSYAEYFIVDNMPS